MRKFLVMLMVVAMASFLFVGCLPVTPPIDPVDPGPGPALPPPIILDIQKSDGVTSIVDLTATTTQYINKVEAGTSILVRGIAYPEALVKVYICSAATPVAVGEATKTGLFSVAVAETALGADSLVAKTLHVTSKEIGLAESVASNVATFILDTVVPGIEEVKATASAEPGVTGGTAVETTGGTAIEPIVAVDDVIAADVVTGTWTIEVTQLEHGDVDPFDLVRSKIEITGPSGYSYLPFWVAVTDGAFTSTLLIPGVTFTLVHPLEDLFKSEIVCKAQSKAVDARATLKFSEDITYAAAMAGTYSIDEPDVYKETNDTGYWVDEAVGDAGATFTITVYGVEDSAGNVGGTSAVPLTKSVIVGAASETLLEP